MIFLAAIVAGLASVGITVVIRVIPPFSKWNEAGVKPWSCDLCMSFWGTLLVLGASLVLGEFTWRETTLAWMPAFTVAFGTIQRITPPPLGEPPIDPPGT